MPTNWESLLQRSFTPRSADYLCQGTASAVPLRDGKIAASAAEGPRIWLTIHAAIVLIAIACISIPPLRAQQTDRAKQIGMKLMCICGCGQVLVQCNHIGCPSSVPMLKELDAHVARAESDDLIVQDFVQEYGVQVLSEPPRTGFNAIAWFLPGIAFAVGLGIVILVIASWRKRVAVRATQLAPRNISPEMLARAREIADRATED